MEKEEKKKRRKEGKNYSLDFRYQHIFHLDLEEEI